MLSIPLEDRYQPLNLTPAGQKERTLELLSDWLHQRLGAALAIEPDGDADSPGPDHVELTMNGVDVAVTKKGPQLVVHVTTQANCHLPFSIQAPRATDGELLAAAIDIG